MWNDAERAGGHVRTAGGTRSKKTPGMPLVRALGKTLRDLTDQMEVKAEQQAMPGIVAWKQGRQSGNGLLSVPTIELLEEHDSAGNDSHRIQGKLGSLRLDDPLGGGNYEGWLI